MDEKLAGNEIPPVTVVTGGQRGNSRQEGSGGNNLAGEGALPSFGLSAWNKDMIASDLGVSATGKNRELVVIASTLTESYHYSELINNIQNKVEKTVAGEETASDLVLTAKGKNRELVGIASTRSKSDQYKDVVNSVHLNVQGREETKVDRDVTGGHFRKAVVALLRLVMLKMFSPVSRLEKEVFIQKLLQPNDSLNHLKNCYHQNLVMKNVLEELRSFIDANIPQLAAAVKHVQASSDYNEQHTVKFMEFQNLLCKFATKKREAWLYDETVPVGWKRRVNRVNGRKYIIRPDGKEFMTRCIALQHMVKDNYNVQEIRAMRYKLCFEGWNEDYRLPDGWLYMVLEEKINDRTWRSFKFFSPEGIVFESMKTAIEFMEMCGYYSKEAVKNSRRFMNRTGEMWKRETEDSSAPHGWRMRITDGNRVLSMFFAFQHMVKNDNMLSQINAVRGFLNQEGLEFDTNLPFGWQVKSKGPDRHWYYIGRHGDFFEYTEKAIEFKAKNIPQVDGIDDSSDISDDELITASTNVTNVTNFFQHQQI